MEVFAVIVPLILVLIFLLPRKADPGKKVSPAGMFVMLFGLLLLILYFANK